MKKIALFLVFSMLGMVTLPLQAALVSTQQVLGEQAMQYDRQDLKQLLAREDVAEQMLSLGVSPEMVDERIDNMTSAELMQLNQQLAAAPAGEGVLGAVVLIFIVFVITDVIGATDIFPFIHPVR